MHHVFTPQEGYIYRNDTIFYPDNKTIFMGKGGKISMSEENVAKTSGFVSYAIRKSYQQTSKEDNAHSMFWRLANEIDRLQSEEMRKKE
jgi:hypothetical protein